MCTDVDSDMVAPLARVTASDETPRARRSAPGWRSLAPSRVGTRSRIAFIAEAVAHRLALAERAMRSRSFSPSSTIVADSSLRSGLGGRGFCSACMIAAPALRAAGSNR
jgi:hypothetical protein